MAINKGIEKGTFSFYNSKYLTNLLLPFFNYYLSVMILSLGPSGTIKLVKKEQPKKEKKEVEKKEKSKKTEKKEVKPKVEKVS
jgi:hypothetical protein